MTSFHVTPADMILSSSGFTDLHNDAAQIYRSLVFSMDEVAGMAGDDDAGKKFAAEYDPAAQKLVDAMASAVGQLGGTANGLYTMALSYLRTEADVAASLMAPQKLPASNAPGCDEEVARAKLRSAVGHNGSGAIHKLLRKFWPQGDPAKLRRAATGWKSFANLVSRLGVEGDKRVQRVTASSSSSAVTSFAQNWAKMHDGCATEGPLLNSLTNAAFKLGLACEAYAKEVEDLRDTLETLAVTAGVVAGVGIALTVFTLGGSDAAVVLAGAGDAAAAPGPKPPPFTVTAGMPPLPHDPTSPFPLLPPKDQADIRAWMARMQLDGRTFQANGPHAPAPPAKADPKINARRAYQVRVAGSTEYRLYTGVTDPATGRELGMDADGVRPEDGAAIDAKYIGQQNSCKSPFRLDNADGVFEFAYENTMEGESKKLEKYASALNDPRNKVNHLELITNDPKASAYFQSLMTAQGVTGRVRIEP
ncbi:restriction endonuclease fold toxin-2 domain-containing protein [Kitasatospora purpeofusca]|uniref:restriction endonuclease fold toxin-2 domain-containing protein n=1 Tax=Kitasatospora purpeofusca TaxID=67352 RepID=UPI002251B7BD|nr:restriction endonuclease fold toxin-2 domain-containing protein [Kitasatospora purpeofusca]MCX4759368.1 hypothetical protein [Kitasatospora purpeofusca]WSR30240.1 hypothetical protein OG715_04310 [Kitasatospora purpeofusca]WSR38475.1 hypothetical protein OG196_04910 [Kitasatospora purpeofusca]